MCVAHGEGIAHMGGIPSSMSEGLDQVLPDACSSIPFRKCQPEVYLLPGRNPSELRFCHPQTRGSQLRKHLRDLVWEGLLWSSGKDSRWEGHDSCPKRMTVSRQQSLST